MQGENDSDRNAPMTTSWRSPELRRRHRGCHPSRLRIVAMAVAAQACVAFVTGCASSISIPALTYVAPVSSEPTVRAVHRALDAMHYAIGDSSHDRSNNYIVTAFDRAGNQITVTVAPSQGQSTHLLVSVVPGENDAIRQQLIRVIDREVRR